MASRAYLGRANAKPAGFRGYNCAGQQLVAMSFKSGGAHPAMLAGRKAYDSHDAVMRHA
jgi:hypothetical protein